MAAASVAVRLSAITGEFEAAFKKSTQTVQGFEKAFGSAASSLKGHQDKINAAFASFSGDKIIAEANQLAVAIGKVGGASKLTEAEQRRVNATLVEAIDKYRALGQSAPASLKALEQATRGVAVATKEIEQPVGKVSGFFNDLGNQVKATALGFIGAQAVIGTVQTAFRTLTVFVGDSVKAYAAAEAAQRKLTTALAAHGGGDVPKITAQYNKLAEQFQQTTAYSDDLINEMQALLVQVGDVMPTEMEGALKAATNLASGLGIDLRQATMLVGKAFEGETGTLKRYGIVIDEAKLKAEGMPAVLDAIQSRFGGQAAAEVETYAGRVKQLANEWDNLQETVGEVLVTDPFLQAFMRKTSESLLGTGAAAAESKGSLLEWWISLTGGTKSAYWNLWLLEQQSILKGQAEIEASARRLASLKPSTPSLFQPTALPSVGLDMDAYWKEQDGIAKRTKQAMEDATRRAASAAEALATVNKKIADLTAGMSVLTDENKEAIKSFTQLGLSAGETAIKLRLPEIAIQKFTEAEKNRTDATKMLATESVKAVTWMYDEMAKQGRLGVAELAKELIDYHKALAVLRDVKPLTALPGVKLPPLQLPDPPPASAWERQFLGLSDASAEAARVSGEIWALSFKTIGGHLNALSRHFDNVFGDILAGAADVSDALSVMFDPEASTLDRVLAGIDLAIDLFKKASALFRDEAHEATNDIRDTFISQFGQSGTGVGSGFANLAKQLNELGPAGDALFQRLINAKKVEDFNAAMNDANKALDAFGTEAERAERRLNALRSAIEGVNKKAELFAAPFSKLLDSRKGTEGDEFDAITRKMQATAQAGQAEFERLGLFVGATFAGMVKETGDVFAAITALGPAFKVLQSGVNEFGLTSTGVIDQLLKTYGLINDAVTGPILQSIQATGQIFAGLQDAGYMTADLFQTVGADIGAAFRELELKGGDVAAAMALSQPILQRLWEAQQIYGVVTDETTAKLLKQAEEQGLVGIHMQDVNQRILDVLVAIADVFGATIPAALRATTTAGREAANRLREDLKIVAVDIRKEFADLDIPPIKINIEYNDPGYTSRDGSVTVPALAHGGIVRRPTLALVGEAGPEAVIPLSQLGQAQGGNMTVIFERDGQKDAEFIVPYLPGAVRRYVGA